jgi:hypothetical protein
MELNADLYEGAKRYHWYYFQIGFLHIIMELVVEDPTNDEKWWHASSWFESKFLEDFGLGEHQCSPFRQGFCILPPMIPDRIDIDPDINDILNTRNLHLAYLEANRLHD